MNTDHNRDAINLCSKAQQGQGQMVPKQVGDKAWTQTYRFTTNLAQAGALSILLKVVLLLNAKI